MVQHSEAASPKILSLRWGRMEVENIGRGKDFKLWPGGGSAWDWQEHGTRHSPGIQAGDCEELLDHGCRIVVLSKGMFKRLKITREAFDYLAGNEVEVIAEDTKKAVRIYNSLVDEGRRVGGLFHTTC